MNATLSYATPVTHKPPLARWVSHIALAMLPVMAMGLWLADHRDLRQQWNIPTYLGIALVLSGVGIFAWLRLWITLRRDRSKQRALSPVRRAVRVGLDCLTILMLAVAIALVIISQSGEWFDLPSIGRSLRVYGGVTGDLCIVPHPGGSALGSIPMLIIGYVTAILLASRIDARLWRRGGSAS